MINMARQVRIFKDKNQLILTAANEFIHQAGIAIEKNGRFNVALAGGSTPLNLYNYLRGKNFSGNLLWEKTHLFWSDERCVPPDHHESNYGMAKSALLDHVSIPPKNIHRMRGEINPPEAAMEYQVEMVDHFKPEGNKPPTFDLILLGMGNDGHTASLFPGSPALDEKIHWVVNVEHTKPPPPLLPRLTFTLPVINSAKLVILLVTGHKKSDTVRRVFLNRETLPAGRVLPHYAPPLWLLDSAAGNQIINKVGGLENQQD